MSGRSLSDIRHHAGRAALAALLLFPLAIIMVGCGKDAAPAVDPAPFQAAVDDYCRSRNYGMAIAEVVALKETGETATMTCKMKEAEGLYGIAVVWEFSLRQDGGRWVVEGHVKR
jgi:hypothetical protein